MTALFQKGGNMAFFVFIIGTILGSFFNVCIYRIPEDESIAYPPSHCGKCNTRLKPLDLIPIMSWIFLKGKCRYCKEKVSIQYPLIEFLTGIIFTIIYLRFGFGIEFIKYIFLMSILIISAVIDLKTQYVFFSVSLVGIVGGILFSIVEIFINKNISSVLLSIIIPLVILGVIILITRKFDGMGIGDLEIFILISLYVSPKIVAVSLFLSIIFGGIVSAVIYLKGYRKKHIAFVPYIALGTFIAILFGENIFNWYLSISMF